MAKDFRKKKIVCLQSLPDLFRRAHHQIDGNAWLDPIQYFHCLFQAGTHIPENDQHVEVRILIWIAVGIRTEHDYALRLELCGNAVTQFKYAFLVDHSERIIHRDDE